MLQPLPYVSSISPYVPGKPLRELERELGITGSVKLASNENPLGPSPKALEAIREYMMKEGDLHRYPEGSGHYLKQALSEALSRSNFPVGNDMIVLGNGTNEVLNMANKTFIGFGDEAVMASPSFVVYAMGVSSLGGVPREVPLKDYAHDLPAMADAVTEKTKMVFIANPNNPTGTIVKKDAFGDFMTRIPENVLVVMDEAYTEYVEDPEFPDSLGYLAGGRNVLILRTFSKVYGLAGLRIGYGITKPAIALEINKIREPFNTNTIAQIAALHALADDEHRSRSVAVNREGKKYLYAELEKLGLPYIPTEANFIYIPLSLDAGTLFDALLRKGVIVRPAGPKAVRVTIGLPEENRRFIGALASVLPTL